MQAVIRNSEKRLSEQRKCNEAGVFCVGGEGKLKENWALFARARKVILGSHHLGPSLSFHE